MILAHFSVFCICVIFVHSYILHTFHFIHFIQWVETVATTRELLARDLLSSPDWTIPNGKGRWNPTYVRFTTEHGCRLKMDMIFPWWLPRVEEKKFWSLRRNGTHKSLRLLSGIRRLCMPSYVQWMRISRSLFRILRLQKWHGTSFKLPMREPRWWRSPSFKSSKLNLSYLEWERMNASITSKSNWWTL